MSSQQSPPIKLNNASFCRVLEGYANDVEKHGRPLDNGLPSVLRDCVERLKSDEAKLEELQGGVYCTNRRVAGGPCGELTARIQERDEALSKLDAAIDQLAERDADLSLARHDYATLLERWREEQQHVLHWRTRAESAESRLETYQTALAQIAAFIEQQRQSVENRVVENQGKDHAPLIGPGRIPQT